KRPKMAKIPRGKPEIFELQPRGLERGTTNLIKLVGTNLNALAEVETSNPKLAATLAEEPEASTNEAWLEIAAAPDLPRGAYELQVKNTNGQSGKMQLY